MWACPRANHAYPLAATMRICQPVHLHTTHIGEAGRRLLNVPPDTNICMAEAMQMF